MNNCIGHKPHYIRQMPWRNGPPAKHQRYSARTICYAEPRICASLATHGDILLNSALPRQDTSDKTNYQPTKTNPSATPGLQHILHTHFVLYIHTTAVSTP